MGENVTDLSKLRDSMTFMAAASKNYRAKVKSQKEKKEALAIEPQVSSTPDLSTNGETSPFGKT